QSYCYHLELHSFPTRRSSDLGEDEHTTFLQMDFGITLDNQGNPMPKLIEIQGFPSVYFFQYMIGKAFKQVMDLPENLTAFFNDIDRKSTRLNSSHVKISYAVF